MRPTDFVMAAALTAAMSAPALAQTTTARCGETRNWIASGFAGTSFGTSTDGVIDLGVDGDLDIVDDDGDSGLDFGGQVAYLWKGLYGAEVIVDFAPSMAVGSASAVRRQPSVNSYMANAIWAIPLGVQGKYQPFLSAGLGGIRVNADMFNVLGDPLSAARSAPDKRCLAGTSVAASWRLPSTSAYVLTSAFTRRRKRNPIQYRIQFDTIGEAALSGLSFWRGNFGLAFRW